MLATIDKVYSDYQYIICASGNKRRFKKATAALKYVMKLINMGYEFNSYYLSMLKSDADDERTLG